MVLKSIFWDSKVKDEAMNKQVLQEDEYDRPYHHLVSFGRSRLDPPRLYEYYGDFEYFGYVTEILSCFPYNQVEKVAEVGCGDGKITLELAKLYPNVHFDGFDISKRAIIYAQAFGFGRPNLSFFDKNLKEADWLYDAVVCVETLEHISDADMPGFVESLRNKTKKYLIVSVPSVNIPLSAKHYRHYDLELLKKQLKGFELSQIKYVHKENWLSKFLLTVLINRFFVSRTRFIVNPVFLMYQKFCKYGNEKNGRHLVGIFVKKY